MSIVDLQYAVTRLEQGDLVAFPTETVYGLGADAMNLMAIAKIYAAKKRPTDHPLIVHLPAGAPLTPWASHIPRMAEKLVEAFWPGPLTLILQKAEAVPTSVSGGQSTIALRSPAHPMAQALLRLFKNGQGGIVAPSANQFGRVSPTTAMHVRSEFPPEYEPVVYILEGEGSEVGIESTIVDLSRVDQGIGPVILRPGAVMPEHIADVLGQFPTTADKHAPRSSGRLAAHYAPSTRLYLLSRAEMQAYFEKNQALISANYGNPNFRKKKIAMVCMRSAPVVPWADDIEVAPPTPTAYAATLYSLLRRLDLLGYDEIIIERPPSTADWAAVNDRLSRAAAAFLD